MGRWSDDEEQKPVAAGKGVTKTIEHVCHLMCTKYCKYTDVHDVGDDGLPEECDTCPLNLLQ